MTTGDTVVHTFQYTPRLESQSIQAVQGPNTLLNLGLNWGSNSAKSNGTMLDNGRLQSQSIA